MSERVHAPIFPTTDWRLVTDAGLDGSANQKLSIAELLGRYMPAMRDYLLRQHQQLSEDEVDDVIQEFSSTKLLSGEFFAAADASRGKFRNFLVRSLENWLIDRFRRQGRQRIMAGDSQLDVEQVVSCTTDPVHVFELAWAESVVAEANRRSMERCRRTKREKLWEFFLCRTAMPSDGTQAGYGELAKQFGFETPAQMANALVTCKRIFRRMLSATLREHAGGGPLVDVEEELAELQEIFSRASAGC